jgi:hypothetical protein
VLGNIAAGSDPFLHLGGNLIDGASSFAGSCLAHLLAQPNNSAFAAGWVPPIRATR